MTRSPQEARLANLDLNLLVSLDALLAERSVSRAAERLGLSQPSLSASLARLRRHFRDDLLDRVGNRYELTPLAAQLAGQTASALAAVARVFAAEPGFDPATAGREFTVLISDYAITVLGPQLAALLQQAPGVRLRLHQVAIPAVNAAAQALRDADAMVLPHGYLTGLPSVQLFTDRWVCIAAAGHPGIGEELTLADLEKLPMVAAHHEPASYTPAGKQLAMLGVQPPVQLVAETFLALPFLVAAGNGVALIQERLARQLAPAVPVRILPCPFEAAPLIEALWWHPMYEHDPGHRWLRQLFTQAARLVHPGGD
ncbi:MAG TPA: LysR family transcriptional regulator [Streptosporangiaceae bacterium]|nr:LysR family transcriptional regulator [Streptosporangiaceae bacterium]